MYAQMANSKDEVVKKIIVNNQQQPGGIDAASKT